MEFLLTPPGCKSPFEIIFVTHYFIHNLNTSAVDVGWVLFYIIRVVIVQIINF